jgi:Kdo2-lipid IVA lauroyltransferase/acyltransferase
LTPADQPASTPAGSPTPAAAARTPRPSHRAEYAALRAAIGALGALPWRQATALGARLGRLGYSPTGVRRGVVERQIAACLRDLTPDQVRATAVASYESLGRTAIEAALLPKLGRQGVLDLFAHVEGWEHLEAARAQGRGVIVVTGHLGNWEIGGSYVAARGVPIDGIARRMANPLFDDFLTRTRERLGMRVVWDGEAVRRTPRALKEGRVVAFLVDQGGGGRAGT